MKINSQKKQSACSLPGRSTHQQRPRPILADKDSEQHKAFIRDMNEFVAKAGLLSDDPFFGGI